MVGVDECRTVPFAQVHDQVLVRVPHHGEQVVEPFGGDRVRDGLECLHRSFPSGSLVLNQQAPMLSTEYGVAVLRRRFMVRPNGFPGHRRRARA